MSDAEAPESAVTLFCRGVDARAAHDVMQRFSTAVEVDGDPEDWSELRTAHPEGRLVVSRLMSLPDSESSRIILGAFQFFRNVESRHDSAKRRVLDVVKTTKMLLGVRVIPHFVSRDDSRWSGLKQTADTVGALIFDGEAMRDGKGLVVLGSDGRSAS